MDLSACVDGLKIDVAVYTGGATALGLSILIIWVLVHEEFPGRRYFVATISAMVVWLVLGALELATPDLYCKMTTAAVTWPAITVAPIAWCFFMWSFCFNMQQQPTKLIAASVSILVIAISATALSNPVHGLFYGSGTTLVLENGRYSARFDHGPLFYAAAAVLYVFLLTALTISAIASFRASRPMRPLMMTLSFATAVPMVANLSYITMEATVFGFDPTPFAFGFVLFALTPLLYSQRGFDLAAMARDLLFFNLPDPVFVVNDKGVVTGANPATSALLPELVPGRSLNKYVPSEISQTVAISTTKGIQKGEVSLGSRIFDMKVLPISRPIGEKADTLGAVVILADVTELRLQEERFRTIASTVSDILWDYDFDTDTWWMSGDWPEKIGVSPSPHQADAQSWFERVHPEDREKLDRSFRDILKSNCDNWEIDYRIVGDGGESIDVLVKSRVVRHPDGRIARMLGNARNISAEKRQSEGYTRAKALEALGQITGGIAHDFNNLLLIIQGNAELLESSELGADDANSVHLIAKASKSAADLTARLLSFSGQRRISVAEIDIRDFIEDLEPLLKSALTEIVELKTQITPSIRNAQVDSAGLQQAIINLAVNARDALKSGGTIQIICDNYRVSDKKGHEDTGLGPGDYVRISIVDNGVGMSQEVMAKAIHPFFTTKDIGKGTGLGLSTVYGFAKQLGGSFILDSELGKGTSASLYLPASDKQRKKRTKNQGVSKPTPRSAYRILVVEDQPDILRHIVKILKRAGFEVSSAEDAASALVLLENGEKYDVLFTDVLMPGGMNGVQLSEAAAKIAPEIKVLFTSGYPAGAFEEIGVNRPTERNLLKKPYRSGDLFAAILRLLES